MAIQRRPFSRLLRHAGDTEDVFSTWTQGVLTRALNWKTFTPLMFRHLDMCVIGEVSGCSDASVLHCEGTENNWRRWYIHQCSRHTVESWSLLRKTILSGRVYFSSVKVRFSSIFAFQTFAEYLCPVCVILIRNIWQILVTQVPAMYLLFLCMKSRLFGWFIGLLHHMQRYFSHTCDGTDVPADWRRSCAYGRARRVL